MNALIRCLCSVPSAPLSTLLFSAPCQDTVGLDSINRTPMHSHFQLCVTHGKQLHNIRETEEHEGREFMPLASSLQFFFRLETSLNFLFQVSDAMTTQSLTSPFPIPGIIPSPQYFTHGSGNNLVAMSYRVLHYPMWFPYANFVNKSSLDYPFVSMSITSC